MSPEQDNQIGNIVHIGRGRQNARLCTQKTNYSLRFVWGVLGNVCLYLQTTVGVVFFSFSCNFYIKFFTSFDCWMSSWMSSWMWYATVSVEWHSYIKLTIIINSLYLSWSSLIIIMHFTHFIRFVNLPLIPHTLHAYVCLYYMDWEYLYFCRLFIVCRLFFMFEDHFHAMAWCQ